MHGGLVEARFFEPNLDALAERFHVYTPERRGHGHTPDVPGPITYQLMADDTIAFLETVVGEPADLVGHSDGAFVAMLVAMQRPELVQRLVMISGGFSKNGEAAPDMEWNVDEIAQFLGPAYGEVSPGRRGPLQGRGDQDRRDGRRRAVPAGVRARQADTADARDVLR
jgi:pimeloyl-ACP methyl ester carboxylesterase